MNDVGWYLRRLRRMSPAEVAARTADQARRAAWARRQVPVGAATRLPPGLLDDRQLPTPLPTGTRDRVPEDARAGTVAAADRLLAGRWSLLGTPRPDIAMPDWFLDPVTGRRAPQDRLAFRIDHRDEDETGNVKSVWELSRHHHLTVLAGAWWLTGEDVYADVVADQLRSWWSANPFLSGVHWTSGIELGVRLISWAWVRRLLHEWPKVGDLFDTNEQALQQLWWHQRFLASFRSSGSSANNHAVAEAAGQLVAACAFPWFAESRSWGDAAARRFERDLRRNTFGSGINRELATDYHRFVTELGLVAAAEATAAGRTLDEATWQTLTASADAAAAMLDEAGRPPRQGDGDEGRGLVLDDPDTRPWSVLLDLGTATVGRADWWPASPGSVAATAVGALLPPQALPSRTGMVRPTTAPRHFRDAGMYLLRTPSQDGPEIWCRCDAGPHGYLSIAAHAHADALSVEVRYGGVDVLVDPGTYCYHGEPAWRSYFRSTLAHNTVEIDGENQSVEGGPFLWSTHARSETSYADVGDLRVQTWTAHHDGYARLDPVAGHERTVSLDRGRRLLSIRDVLAASTDHRLRLTFHLGPEVEVRLAGHTAELSWRGVDGDVAAQLRLPEQLSWSVHRGETEPVLGWYSPRFGQRVPTTTLLGTGRLQDSLQLESDLLFPGAHRPGDTPHRTRSDP